MCVLSIHAPCFLMCIQCYVSFIRLHVYAFAMYSMVHCGSAFEPGASGLPYYCTPPVCIPGVLGALAVWRHNNNKTKKSPGDSDPALKLFWTCPLMMMLLRRQIAMMISSASILLPPCFQPAAMPPHGNMLTQQKQMIRQSYCDMLFKWPTYGLCLSKISACNTKPKCKVYKQTVNFIVFYPDDGSSGPHRLSLDNYNLRHRR